MKIDQIAFYCGSEGAVASIKSWFGLQDAKWVHDTVTGESIISMNGRTYMSQNVAELQFNYDLGIELEILRYIRGDNFHMENEAKVSMPFVSHVGIHLEDNEDFPPMPGAKLVQETRTLSHTGEYLTSPTSPGYGRKYHYRIFQIQPCHFVKYIKRIHPAPMQEQA